LKYRNSFIIFFAIAFSIGILIGFYIAEKLPPLLPFVCLLLLLLAIVWFRQQKNLHNTSLFGIILFGLFICLGCYSYQGTLPTFQASHYIQQQDSTIPFVQLRIKEVLKSDRYNFKYTANIEAINATPRTGVVLLSITKDSLTKPLDIDATIVLKAPFTGISSPKNPYQFNYAHYLQTQGIYHQIRCTSSEILRFDYTNHSMRGYAERLRNYCISKLEKTSIAQEELAIIQALVLGQKRALDKQQYEAYAAAGAIHILAVSGLHVGILYAILFLLFSPITTLKKGDILRSILIVISLWGYAVLTGLSPSVSRAVTMFSFFAIAQSLHRKTSTINTLGLSFVTLLLYNPLFLFHVGFQLSYIAVLSIISIQPKLSSYYKPRKKLVAFVWNTATVTLAAQIGLAPLSIYYFHQFPGLFFMTNLVVLPVLGTILGMGILVILLASFSILPEALANFYGNTIGLLNDFIAWVAAQDDFLFQEISFPGALLFVSYLILFSCFLLWKKWHIKQILFCLYSCIVALSVLIGEQWSRKPSQLIIFQKSRQTIIAIKQEQEIIVFLPDSVSNSMRSIISKYRTGINSPSISEKKALQVFKYKDRTFLILDSLALYPNGFQNPVVVLTQSTQVHLVRFIDSVQPQQIIADGSNYKSYVNRWKETCRQKKIPFHSTYEKGAFVWE
jgi:competence protein ComEC